ncbi:MAG: phosphoadenylyl-sulfate reductase [Cytophagales bacterium]|nr:phosphoadenylyl-sulfate reductase [Cytophagales bacterium]
MERLFDNNHYTSLTPRERLEKLFSEHDEAKILVTSSFGSTSVVLLHMLSQVKPGHPIHFVNTGFLFQETLDYKKQLIEKLGLKVINVKARENRHRFTRENQSWRFNHDLCCFINKVEPVNELRASYDVWISGLLAFQNANRSKTRIFEPKKDIVKFHPIIDMTAAEVSLYMTIYELPSHPLVAEGYESIGCTHCTRKGKGREGRWFDKTKTECGLHA